MSEVTQTELPLNFRNISKEDVNLFINNVKAHANYEKMTELKKISMLHVDVLLLLHALAEVTPGGVLEIGPYVGGSTIAIASAIRDTRPRQFVTIEPGGKYPEHQWLPTDDIFGDLVKNVRAWGVSDYVTLMQGHSNNEDIIQQVRTVFKPSGIGLLFIDADGFVQRDIENYRSLLLPGAIVVLDDYSTTDMKTPQVRAETDKAIQEGFLEPLGVFGWGTWFGRYCG